MTTRRSSRPLPRPKAITAQLKLLEGSDPERLPLYGVPFAVKDNIDVAGLPTTCACPDFAYMATRDAVSVARLRRAGAIVVGKTNLDQFATGLVGRRLALRHAAQSDPRRSGARRLQFRLRRCRLRRTGAVRARHRHRGFGAHSGRAHQYRRAEAKPRPGLDHRRGAGLPFARLRLGLRAHRRRCLYRLAGDGAARIRPIRSRAICRSASMGAWRRSCASACRAAVDCVTFGDRETEGAFLRALARLGALGADIVEIEMEPFFETARLL